MAETHDDSVAFARAASLRASDYGAWLSECKTRWRSLRNKLALVRNFVKLEANGDCLELGGILDPTGARAREKTLEGFLKVFNVFFIILRRFSKLSTKKPGRARAARARAKRRSNMFEGFHSFSYNCEDFQIFRKKRKEKKTGVRARRARRARAKRRSKMF